MSSTIQLVIQATDAASAVLKNTGAAATTMGGKIKAAFANAKASLADYNKKTAAARQSMAQFGQAAQMVMRGVTQAFDEASASATRLGRVDVAKNIDGMGKSFTMLKDVLFQIPVGGRDFLSWMGDAAAGVNNLAKVAGALSIKAQLASGAIDQQTASAQLANVMNGQLANSTSAVIAKVGGLSPDERDLAAATRDAAAAADEHAKKLDDLTGAASDLAFGMGELTKETLFNQAAAGLDKQASYELAKAMGLIDPAAAAAKSILDDLTLSMDPDKPGAYIGQVKLLSDAIATLPEGKTVTVEYVTKYTNELNKDLGPRERQGGAIGDAMGGPVSSGGAYWVGERGPEMFVPSTGGRIIPNGQSGSAVTVNISANVGSGVDIEYLAGRVARRIQLAQGM